MQETTSSDIIEKILTYNNIQKFSITNFPKNPLLQDRQENDTKANEQIKKALQLREDLSMPFWDAIMLTFFSNPDYSKTLLNNVKFHNANIEIKTFSFNEFEPLKNLVEKAEINYAFVSKVILAEGTAMHVPMLDLHCPNNAYNLALAIDVINSIYNYPGFLLESGDSYHFYGQHLFTEKEMKTFLGLALQYSPVIDKMWIAHQLREQCCALRISAKHNIVPFLVHEFN